MSFVGTDAETAAELENALPIENRPIPAPAFIWKGEQRGPTRKLEGDAEPFVIIGPEELWAEKIVAFNNLRPIAFLQQGVLISRAVAHITVSGGAGTGFMIADDLLLTNNHVLPDSAAAAQALIRFNYETDLNGSLQPTDLYRCLPDDGFHTSVHIEGLPVSLDRLDYTVVRLDRPAGKTWGKIPLADSDVRVPEDVVIIQHPGGAPKQIAIADNETAYVDNLVCQYLTDTLPGSSGSPVFDDSWNLVALHHSGGWIPQPGDPTSHLRNEGIRIGPIINDLPPWARS